jgi:hypothetical protein
LAKSDWDYDYGGDGDKPTTSGAWMSDAAAAIAAYFGSGIVGLAMALGPIFCIALDLFLGPQFIDAWTTANGTPLTGIAWVVPYFISIAMSGLQYALFDRLALVIQGEGRSRKAVILIIVVGVIAIADTLIDVAGMTAWRAADAEAANIVPSNADEWWWIQAFVVGSLCLFHEPMLKTLLSRFKDKMADKTYRGAALVQGGVMAGAWILNITKAAALLAGGASMFLLDIVLMPQMTGGGEWLMWVASIGLTALIFGLWEFSDNVGIRGMPILGRIMIVGAWLVAAGDTALDVAGYTTGIFGDGTKILWAPESPTWVWALGALIVGAICFAGERMLKEMVWRPWKGSEGGSGSDWDSGSSGSGKKRPKKDTGRSDWDSGDWDSGSRGRDKGGSDWDSGAGDWDRDGDSEDKSKGKDKDSGGGTADWV